MKSLKKRNGDTSMRPVFKNFFDNFWNADQFFSDDFPTMRSRWMPAVNIKDNEKDFEIEMAAPGFTKNDFDVKVENGMLRISAEREETTEEKEVNFTRKEFSYNSFERSFTLPENVDNKDIDAKYTDGVLRLTLKKTKVETPKVKKIAVK